MTYQLRHRQKGVLLLVPCATHDHDACWLFAADVAWDVAPDGPVPFTKTKVRKQIGMLCALLNYDARDLVIEPLHLEVA